jgi:hypothetical protein
MKTSTELSVIEYDAMMTSLMAADALPLFGHDWQRALDAAITAGIIARTTAKKEA